MTKSFEYMLYLFGCGARGIAWEQNNQIDIDEIYGLAVSQNIWQVIYPLIKDYPDARKYYQEFLYSVIESIMQKEFTLSIIKELESHGIKCCMLKGSTVSGLYAQPDCRISGDTDILINPDDEAYVAGFLEQKGYDVKGRDVNEHHLKAYHKKGGLLEVHVRLYSLPTEEIIFNGIKLYNNETVKNNDLGCHTLSVDDNLMYLTAHYIKHFINGGGGIRQMMDLLLFMEKYKDTIDFDKYNALLRELRYDNLIAVVKSIGTKYFGFEFPIVSDKLMDKILADTEKGGIFGFSAKDRAGFYDEYCKRRTTKSLIMHSLYMNTKSERSLLRKIFPTQKFFINLGYRYAKYTLLVPIAWVHRFFNILYRKIIKKSPENNNIQRMDMMRQLGMID